MGWPTVRTYLEELRVLGDDAQNFEAVDETLVLVQFDHQPLLVVVENRLLAVIIQDQIGRRRELQRTAYVRLKHYSNRSKVIWEKAKSLLVCIRQGAAEMYNCVFSLGRSTPTSPLARGQGPHQTQCVTGATSVPAKWHLNLSNG